MTCVRRCFITILIFTLPLSWGCSEYGIEELDKSEFSDEPNPDSDPSKEPSLIVDPNRVYEESICTTTETIVSLQNAGEGDLEIYSAAVVGTGWYLHPQSFPIVVPAYGVHNLDLMGQAGTAILEIQSNDPAEPQRFIELTATEDMPPNLTITDPFNGAVIPVAGQQLTGQVSDDIDNPEDLTVVWSSDIDGVLGTSQPNPDGSFTLEHFMGTPGVHELTVNTVDSCQNPALFPLTVCQQFGYEVESLDISTWNFEGSASWDSQNGWVQLTPASTNQVGSAFSTAVPVNGGNVEIEFLFYIGDGSGADGISLTALDIDRMSGFLGGTGCGIGYGGDAGCTGGPALPGWSIEVDTHYNSGQDPTESDHMAFMFDGDVDGPVHWEVLPQIENTGWHTMRVSVNDPNVRVEIDGVVYMDQSVNGYLDFPAYIGFTAGTGSLTNLHLIDSLVVGESVCQE